jgi:SNF family Na+-dependent transporter
MTPKSIKITIRKGDEIQTFESLKKCAYFLGTDSAVISKTIKNNYKTVHGWEIVSIEGSQTKRSDIKRKVYIFDNYGEFIDSVASIYDAAQFLGIDYRKMHNVMKSGSYEDYIVSFSKTNQNTYLQSDFI